jgi:hypothetical protein
MRGYLLRRLTFVFVFILAPWLAAQAGTVHGTVKNGTTGKPGAGVEVILIQLQGGMQPVSNSKTDAQGQFTFDNPSLGAQPMLVRAVYRGVNFHQPVPPGKSEVEVEIFEPTPDAKTVTIPTHIVILQPNGSNLIVGEIIRCGMTQPEKAYFEPTAILSCGARYGAVQQRRRGRRYRWCKRPSTRPRTTTRSHMHFVGRSGVRYSYELPYAEIPQP